MIATTWTPETVAAALAEESFDGATALMAAISAETGWPIVDDCLVPHPDVWHADDGNATIHYDGLADETGRFHFGHEPLVDSGLEAAKEYAETGDWGTRDRTIWVAVMVWREGIDIDGDTTRVDQDTHTIALQADEPECIDDDGHEWEDGQVWGSGGGVKWTDTCSRCGLRRHTDTWAQDPDSGEQGLTSVEYEDA